MTDVAIIVLPFRGQKSSFAVLVLRDDMQEQLTNRLRELKAENDSLRQKIQSQTLQFRTELEAIRTLLEEFRNQQR